MMMQMAAAGHERQASLAKQLQSVFPDQQEQVAYRAGQQVSKATTPFRLERYYYYFFYMVQWRRSVLCFVAFPIIWCFFHWMSMTGLVDEPVSPRR